MSKSQLNRGSAKDPASSSLPVTSDLASDLGCNILHIDMDAFFASVELRERPELIGKPMIVGHAGNRGVVLSATYEARALGVHSAMPMSRAIRIAPQAVIIEPSHSKYQAVSKEVMEIFHTITPLVQPLSVDEAFLDVSGALRLIGHPAQIGELVRKRVREEQNITCSVGVASTMFVAKLATNYAKPDGLHVVPADGIIEFLHPLPISALWGVGEKTAEQLNRLGMKTVADIAHTPLSTLIKIVGEASGRHLYDLSWGRDSRSVTPEQAEKSISAERTFDTDIDDPEVLHAELLDLSEKVASRLRGAGLVGRTVAIKVRFSDFTTVSRSKSLAANTDVSREIYAVVKSLYDALHLARVRVRLLGVKIEGLQSLESSPIQLAFQERESGWREAEQVMDRADAKFGLHSIRPARLIKPKPEPDK